MSKRYTYGRLKDRPDSINFDNPVDLDDVNEVAAEKEAEVQEPVVEEPTKEVIKIDNTKVGTVNRLSNMRKTPNATSDVLTTIIEGGKVKVYDEAHAVNGFYHIKYNGLDGYIMVDLCDIEGD